MYQQVNRKYKNQIKILNWKNTITKVLKKFPGGLNNRTETKEEILSMIINYMCQHS